MSQVTRQGECAPGCYLLFHVMLLWLRYIHWRYTACQIVFMYSIKLVPIFVISQFSPYMFKW